MNLSLAHFETFHQAVHGYPPFEWQSRLLAKVTEERRWPRVLDLPTGAGKTSCIDIALFALALDSDGERWAPRRIVMVVDRRVVVDQVAERGRKVLRALLEPASGVVKEVARRLRSLSHEAEEPLGVFTLRGGIPKDDGWARTPDQPLVIASTVDQVGSRLLVQGYGVSRGMRPVHAGLLGNDTLLLLDEVHLSRPFAETLDQLDHLRTNRMPSSPVRSRFHHVFLSATPGHTPASAFRLLAAEERPGSPLAPRLHARKPVRLEDADDRRNLERGCVAEAKLLLERHAVVAVVLNRVASAMTVARQLEEVLGGSAQVFLMTGRMRPIDRDDLLASVRPRITTGRVRGAPAAKLVVVATQCIEAGADFDFDALVTEAASLDALRQRFGRVDRLGIYGKAEGVILRDKTAGEDPIYGKAIAATMKWLGQHRRGKEKTVDFGVLALPLPEGAAHEECLAPKPSAPILLPAYLDLWIQTSPSPVVVPDVGLFLHGPNAGPADVQVVWRADISDEDLEAARADSASPRGAVALSVVSAVRPSSLEAVSIPFVAALQWLRGTPVGEIRDVEGNMGDVEDVETGSSLALRWKGDDSDVVSFNELRPGDTIIVPSTRGGISKGSFDGSASEPVSDLAERASLFARGRPVLRVQQAILMQLGLSDAPADLDDLPGWLDLRVAEATPGTWQALWLRSLVGAERVVVDAEPAFAMLRGKRVGPEALRKALAPGDDATTLEAGVELTTDEDDSYHAGRPVPLAEHSKDVERFARKYAASAGLDPDLKRDVELAGWLHDIGKADRRFQILLRGGSEIDYLKDETPWAKSGMPPGAKGAHRLAQRSSRYPSGARHEVQSVAMLGAVHAWLGKTANDPELVLYLVGSHHGYCRPFAPAVTDAAPIEVALAGHSSEHFGTLDLPSVRSDHGLHRLDAPLADRFWHLVAKYGWLELCWLEAILRLADHRGSEEEQEER